jgi:chemotaxis protein MotB
MRRRREEDHENPDRWVVSYADFITLLFAFFTTLYALSHVDMGKLERFAGSMKTSFKEGRDTVHTSVIEGVKPMSPADVDLEKDIRAGFAGSGILEGIVVTRERRGVVVSLAESLLFDGSAAELKHEAGPLLASVAAAIRRSGREIVIEGHTDNIPLRDQRYAGNLELSAARAANAFARLMNEEQIGPERMSAAGYGEYRPIAPNATPEGRARNRRIDILFVAKQD